MQIWHGTPDTILYYPNFGEEVKEWTVRSDKLKFFLPNGPWLILCGERYPRGIGLSPGRKTPVALALYPQRGFCLASSSTRARTLAGTGGRPGALG